MDRPVRGFLRCSHWDCRFPSCRLQFNLKLPEAVDEYYKIKEKVRLWCVPIGELSVSHSGVELFQCEAAGWKPGEKVRVGDDGSTVAVNLCMVANSVCVTAIASNGSERSAQSVGASIDEAINRRHSYRHAHTEGINRNEQAVLSVNVFRQAVAGLPSGRSHGASRGGRGQGGSR